MNGKEKVCLQKSQENLIFFLVLKNNFDYNVTYTC